MVYLDPVHAKMAAIVPADSVHDNKKMIPAIHLKVRERLVALEQDIVCQRQNDLKMVGSWIALDTSSLTMCIIWWKNR
jgi:hypothetical protein